MLQGGNETEDEDDPSNLYYFHTLTEGKGRSFTTFFILKLKWGGGGRDVLKCHRTATRLRMQLPWNEGCHMSTSSLRLEHLAGNMNESRLPF